jgi:hypothetical protein
MNQRKNEPLKVDEWFSFFFFPINISSKLFPTKGINDFEVEKFKEFGFDKKLKQSEEAKFCGVIFYAILIILLSLLTS